MTSYKDLFQYKPTEEREMAETFITLIGDGKTTADWIKHINTLDPKDPEDRAMLEAISKGIEDMDVRKEATRRLYYTK